MENKKIGMDLIKKEKKHGKRKKETFMKGLEMMKGWKSDKPKPFNDSTFLYIRATEDDRGERPIGRPWWISPDLNVISADGSERTEIEAGTQYIIECNVFNGGGLSIPSATVDFFLCNPTLARYVSVTKFLGVVSTPIPAAQSDILHGQNRVTILWTASSEDAGHKCLFSRVYSFSPIDLPLDFEYLDTLNDRHIGQQNLNIVQQNSITIIDFDLFTPEAFKRDKHEFQIEIHPVKKIPEFMKCKKNIRNLKFQPVPSDTKFKIKTRKDAFNINSEVFLEQRSENLWVGKIIGKGYAPLKLVIPDFAFKPYEANIFEVVQLNGKQNDPSGGFTIIIHG